MLLVKGSKEWKKAFKQFKIKRAKERKSYNSFQGAQERKVRRLAKKDRANPFVDSPFGSYWCMKEAGLEHIYWDKS